MIVSESCPPPLGIMGGSVHKYVRGLSPWHQDAFPENLKHACLEKVHRSTGWFGQDWAGNDITFVPDGTEFK